jgi:hypothetical protein
MAKTLRRLGGSNHQAMREYMKKVLAKVENTICYGWQGGKLFNWNRGKVFNWNLHPLKALLMYSKMGSIT